MKKPISNAGRHALVAAAVSCLVTLAPAGAQESGTEEQAIEIVRQGIPHDALFALDMSGELGIAVGNFGLMLETRDGGQTWTELPAKTELALLGVSRAGERQIAVGQQGLVLTRTGDGEWQKVDSGLPQRLLNVDMNEAGLAVAVGEFGFVARSRDFGATWEATPIDWTGYNDEGYEPHLYVAEVTAEGVAMIGGEFGLILRSEDGGDSWNAVHQGDESVFAMSFAADGTHTGYAVGQEGFIVKSTDGGLSWQRLESESEANLLGVWSGHSEIVVVGIRQLLRSSDDGATFSKTNDLNVIRTWFQGIDAGVTESKAGEKGFLRQQNVYIAGHRATIARVVK